MTFFRSYFDESGKFKDHRVVSFCGVLASPDSRIAFNEAWDALLRKNQLSAFHTSNALRASRSLSPVIRSESPTERCETLKPFVDCILNNLDLGVSITIDVAGFSKWTPGAKKMVGGNDNPAYVGFMQAVGAIKKYACRDDDRISVMCDDDEDTALNFYALYRRFKKIDSEMRRKLVSLSFSNDEMYPGLQAADLVAGLMRLEALRAFGHHTHDFRSLAASLTKPRPDQKLKWIGFTGDSESMEEMGESLQRRSRAV
jgi:hypothetical protein